MTHNHVISNTISFAELSGIFLSAGVDGAVNDNLIKDNLVFHNVYDGITLTAGSDHNTITNNESQTNNRVGLSVAGDYNLIASNWVWNNTLDLADYGVGNRWRNNTYDTSKW